jgi:hypothetical protein
MATTLLLDRTIWDLCLDASGNIALAREPYALAQDVASAIKTFLGEVWYDTTIGVPYFEQVLGQFPSLIVVKELFVAAALTVPGVASARCFLDGIEGRELSGQVQITDATGITSAIGFGTNSSLAVGVLA